MAKEQKAKGKKEQIKGKAKEVVGRATGDAQSHSAGHAQLR